MKVNKEALTNHLYDWLSKQKYNNENILHAAVCCDYTGRARFKKAIKTQIEELIFETEKRKLYWIWEEVQQLNLDVGLKQETLDEIQDKIQERLKIIKNNNYDISLGK